MTGLCMAIPTSRKGATRHQLTQLKKFVMESGFGHSIIQVDNEPAIIHWQNPEVPGSLNLSSELKCLWR
eukprot:5994116-Amphidinium_carterae.1